MGPEQFHTCPVPFTHPNSPAPVQGFYEALWCLAILPVLFPHRKGFPREQHPQFHWQHHSWSTSSKNNVPMAQIKGHERKLEENAWSPRKEIVARAKERHQNNL